MGEVETRYMIKNFSACLHGKNSKLLASIVNSDDFYVSEIGYFQYNFFFNVSRTLKRSIIDENTIDSQQEFQIASTLSKLEVWLDNFEYAWYK